jgi:hypothetical protein
MMGGGFFAGRGDRRPEKGDRSQKTGVRKPKMEKCKLKGIRMEVFFDFR